MEKVELHQAFMWDCPDCGKENFERAITMEPSPEEDRTMREEMGVEDAMQGHWLLAPNAVRCKSCGLSYQAEEH